MLYFITFLKYCKLDPWRWWQYSSSECWEITNDTVSYCKGSESSATLFWESQILQFEMLFLRTTDFIQCWVLCSTVEVIGDNVLKIIYDRTLNRASFMIWIPTNEEKSCYRLTLSNTRKDKDGDLCWIMVLAPSIFMPKVRIQSAVCAWDPDTQMCDTRHSSIL